MSEQEAPLDLDARKYLAVTIGAKEYRIYAPPMSKTPRMAEILQRVEKGSEGLDGGGAQAVEGFVQSIADFVGIFTEEIPREKVLALDLTTALKFMGALRDLLPKEAPSPAPAAS